MSSELNSHRPWLVLLWGAPAAGKTTLAELILKKTRDQGLVVGHLSPDALNQTVVGDHYHKTLRPALYDTIFTLSRSFLQPNSGLLLDGTFLRPEARARVFRLAAESNACLISVQTTCSLECRLRRNGDRPEHLQVPVEWLREALRVAHYQRRAADLLLDTEALDPHRCCHQTLKSLERRLWLARGLRPKQLLFSPPERRPRVQFSPFAPAASDAATSEREKRRFPIASGVLCCENARCPGED